MNGQTNKNELIVPTINIFSVALKDPSVEFSPNEVCMKLLFYAPCHIDIIMGTLDKHAL